MISTFRQVVLVVLALGSGACSTLPDRHPPPPDQVTRAVVLGFPPEIRFFGDEAIPDIDARIERARTGPDGRFPEAWTGPQHYLALSGGGPFGAFGAGLMAGWTEHGDRPTFTIVTGISAGALIAPFAFLGPDYDDELAAVFTVYGTTDLLERRGLLQILTGDAVADTSGLRALIAQHLGDQAIERIAAEGARGRQLWIGTTNLDIGRPVIWNITNIAASTNPDRVDLIHDILLASASIPGAFPPVYFDVGVGGGTFDELHVDGGITSPVFLYPGALPFAKLLDTVGVTERPTVYLVSNVPLTPKIDPVDPPSLRQIATRSTLTMIQSQTIGAISSVYLAAQRDGMDFKLAYIPADFVKQPDEPFDPVFMGALFERGRAAGAAGAHWSTTPVDITPGSADVTAPVPPAS